MSDKSKIKDWLIIAAIFGPDKTLTIFNIVVWGSLVALLLTIAGCFG